jgi:N-acetylneuraminate epimerase
MTGAPNDCPRAVAPGGPSPGWGAYLLTLLLTIVPSTAATTATKPSVAYRGVELPIEARPSRGTDFSVRPLYPLTPGMAGIIAGTHQGVLIAAGGANFPDRMPWDGGVKKYYDEIFVLLPGESAWRAAGRLPERRAYAAVVSTPRGMLALGGENAEGVRDDALWLTWDGSAVRTGQGPRLPAPRTSVAAVVLDGRVFAAGGYAPGVVRASAGDFWSLDLARPDAGWRSLPAWPGPTRGQAVMAAMGGAVYLFSGLHMLADADGKPQPTYLGDAYRYRGDAWERLADLPWSAIAAPSPAPTTMNPARIFVLGGVDGRLVGKVPRDTRVPADILCFDVASGTWRRWPERWPDPVVTTPAVRFRDEWWFVSGEIMAGVRTTSVWSWQPEKIP